MNTSKLVLLGCVTPGGWATDLETCMVGFPPDERLTRADGLSTPVEAPQFDECEAPGLGRDQLLAKGSKWETFDVAVWPPERAKELTSTGRLVNKKHGMPPELLDPVAAEVAQARGVYAPGDMRHQLGSRLEVDLDGDGQLDVLWTMQVVSRSANLFGSAIVGKISSRPDRMSLLLVEEEPSLALRLEHAIDLDRDGRLEIIYRRHRYMETIGGGLATYRNGKLSVIRNYVCKE